MGIYLHLDVSLSVTKEEWKRVYEESLKLVEALQLADIDSINYAGYQLTCIVPTKEQESKSFFGKPRVGWSATGDYVSLKTAEEYFFPRDLVEDEKVDVEAGDAMLEAVSEYISETDDDAEYGKAYTLWNNKSQGEPYHIYLLAIACMVEDRLGEKAYVYGDITRGQCRNAVELANQYLDTPIGLPAQCDMNRLFERVNKLPLTDMDKLNVLRGSYLGKKDNEFGEFIREHFDSITIHNFWKERFSNYSIRMIGFLDMVKLYFTLGFGLEELCTLVSIENEDGQPQYEEFIKIIMDSKMHLKEKNCKDFLEIDPEGEQAYSIWTLMAQFAFGSAKNHKVDRYIPIEEIREALKKGLGEKCNVDGIIDAYLEAEALSGKVTIADKENASEEELREMCKIDASEVFTQLMDKKYGKIIEDYETYDIPDWDDLLFYKQGNSIRPDIQKMVGSVYGFYQEILKEDRYKELMQGDTRDRCTFLVQQNRYILLREQDWQHIFSEIENKTENFARYYPMVRVNTSDSKVNHVVCGFVLNDNLYAYAEELSRTIPDDKEEKQEDE